MRVAQIGMGWFDEQSGGLNRYYRDLLRFLPATGVDVSGLVAGSPEVARMSGGAVQAFAASRASLAARLAAARARAAALARTSRPDLVAAHFALYMLPMLHAFRGVPRVIHFHGPWAAEASREGRHSLDVWAKRRLVERPVYRGARLHIALSRAFATVLRDRYGLDERTIRVIPGGIDADRFAIPLARAEARRKLGWPRDRPTVLSVRRLVPRMGLDDLVDAMTAVRRKIPDALLMIGGRGPLEAALRDRIAARDLAAHVRLIGFVPDDDLPLAYRAADLSVVPTVALEGFGLITLESLATGTPVLVTPVGGLPEAVADLSETLVLPGAGPDILADGLIGALGGTTRLPDAEACRAYARARFDWPIIARRVAAAYRDALA